MKTSIIPSQTQNCSHELLYRKANIPSAYWTKTFAEFKPETDSHKRLLALCEEPLDRNLYLYGPIGTGKTHIATAILKRYLHDGYRGMFVNAVRFLSRLRPPFNEAELMNKAESVAVLVLDDFGMQKDSDWTYEQLAYLLNERYVNERLTIVTSNLTLEILEQDGIQGQRISSRIKEMCDIFLLTGHDYRDKMARSETKHKTVNIKQGSDENVASYDMAGAKQRQDELLQQAKEAGI